jgi:aminoglycoside 2''-phosphotransferase
MERFKHYLTEIRNRYPELTGPGTSYRSDGGQYNDVLILDGAVVFRFPKYSESVKAILKEIEILRIIHGKLPLPIPDPIYSRVDTQTVGDVFMGYPLIPGEPLWRDILWGIEDEMVLRRFASQLAGFLADLHRIPWQESGLNRKVDDTLDEWVRMYEDIRENLYPMMRPDARKDVSEHFERFINDPRLHQFKPVIRHGDFGSCNILYDPQRYKISGIIDFGSAGLGDPAVDLAAVSTFGAAFFERILKHYPATQAELERVAFYRGTFALQEALHGWKNKDQEALESGMAVYR